MTLIAILLAMASERYWYPFATNNPFLHLLSWRDMLTRRCGHRRWFNGPAGLLLTVIPVVFLVALLQLGLAGEGLLLGLLALVFSLLVLVSCIGDQRFGAQIRDYMAVVSRGEIDAVVNYLNGITGRRCQASTLRQLNLIFLGLVLARMNDRVLALLFWFVVLGPLGAVLYRSVAQLQWTSLTAEDWAQQHDMGAFQTAVLRLKGIMDWLPTRLTALSFGVIGSFIDVMPWWRDASWQRDDDGVKANERLLLDVGLSALQLQSSYVESGEKLGPEQACEHVVVVRALSKRALLVWVTVLALMTLAGWLG